MTKEELINLRNMAIEQQELSTVKQSYNLILKQELKSGTELFYNRIMAGLSLQVGFVDLTELKESVTFEEIDKNNYNFRKYIFYKYWLTIKGRKKISEKESNYLLLEKDIINIDDICHFTLFEQDYRTKYEGYFSKTDLIHKLIKDGYKDNFLISYALDQKKGRPDIKRLTITIPVNQEQELKRKPKNSTINM